MAPRKAFRLYRNTFKDRGGEACKSPKWYMEFRSHDERVRRVSLFTDKRQSARAAETIANIVYEVQSFGRVTDPELIASIGRLPERLRDWLQRIGLVEGARVSAFKSMDGHIADFKASMKSRTVKHQNMTERWVERIVDEAEIVSIAGITTSAVNVALNEFREDDLSIRTVNSALVAMKAFTRWLVRDGRLAADPIAFMKCADAAADRRHVRRELTADEIDLLIAEAEQGPTLYGITGPVRAMLYRLAIETGFRAGELFSLTPESFRLRDDPPCVVVEAAYSKRRRQDAQPIRADLAELLEQFLSGIKAGSPVFTPSDPAKAFRYIKADLEAARARWIRLAQTKREIERREKSDFLRYKDSEKRFADFHSTRHTFISAIVAGGASVKTAQELARHSTPTLTIGRYSHVRIRDLKSALDALPTTTTKAAESKDSKTA